MAGKNSQIHLTLETSQLEKIRDKAESLEISVAELIRRKLEDPPTKREVIELRKLKSILLGDLKISNKKNGNKR